MRWDVGELRHQKAQKTSHRRADKDSDGNYEYRLDRRSYQAGHCPQNNPVVRVKRRGWGGTSIDSHGDNSSQKRDEAAGEIEEGNKRDQTRYPSPDEDRFPLAFKIHRTPGFELSREVLF